MTTRQDAPAWYRHALDVPHGDSTVDVDGAASHYLTWGEPGGPGLVFVHGGAAHAHWWTHVAAQFAGNFRIAALDLSGHGDSDRRDRYSLEKWTDEVIAVADAADMAGPPIVIGHSMGAVPYTHLRAHETREDHVCRLLLVKKKQHSLFYTHRQSLHA